MGLDDPQSRLIAVEVLIGLGRISIREGEPAIARARLQESLAQIATGSPQRTAAAALHAIAELAESANDPEQAVEFYCACRRVLGRIQEPSRPEDSEARAAALSRLRDRLGVARFEAAWATAQRTPFPLEFYLERAARWLEAYNPPARDGHALGPAPESQPESPPGTTEVLISHALSGSDSARGRLARRHIEPLRRFGRGRLPAHARDLHDTDDLVQISLERGLNHLDGMKSKRKGGFLAYLRMIFMNLVRDEIRRTSRYPKRVSLSESVRAPQPSQLEAMVDREAYVTYQTALAGLPGKQRTALELRLEEGLSYQEVADVIGSPSANAARMLVGRAMAELTKRMRARDGR